MLFEKQIPFTLRNIGAGICIRWIFDLHAGVDVYPVLNLAQ
jgi:hypothetical protein